LQASVAGETHSDGVRDRLQRLCNYKYANKGKSEFKSGIKSEKNNKDRQRNDEKYADKVLNVEAEGILNQILVASDLNVSFSNNLGMNIWLGDFNSGKLTKAELLKEIRAEIGSATTGNGKNARQEYIDKAQQMRENEKLKSRKIN